MFGSHHNGGSERAHSAPSSPTPPTETFGSPPPLNTAAAERPSCKDGSSKRKSSKAKDFIESAMNTLTGSNTHTPEEKEFSNLLKDDPQIQPTGSHNNQAGESVPGPKCTFRVGVTEDRNKKCRKTMEDTHSFLYNFLQPITSTNLAQESVDTDNGYFAIFDGHAGSYAADWCGRKLHVVLEETIHKNPHAPIPELFDRTFTNCDVQLEKLPVKNSGCTAVCAVLRWEERPAEHNMTETPDPNVAPRLERKRILYTANVGDARIVLCRNGRALRLSYDHKGSDEHEGKRVTNAGGLILNNRVNGVLAVTRALGDSYMKNLVTGHPYTTESVLENDKDEFIILACDGLWDVCSDQEAVDLIRNVHDPQQASKVLIDHALSRFSTDNLSCMVVRLDPSGRFESIEKPPDSLPASDDAVDTELGSGLEDAAMGVAPTDRSPKNIELHLPEAIQEKIKKDND